MPPSPTLLILAAGMGSRYGGLKQIDGVGPAGEALLEYSIFDALRAGFGNVICVIRREIESDIRHFLESRLPRSVRIDYAVQEFDDLPDGCVVPAGCKRTRKPWGTGQAVLAARSLINKSFLMINADDFYGRAAFSLAYRFLTDPTSSQDYAIIGYPLSSTLSDYGPVSRGICRIDKNNLLQKLIEQKNISRRGGQVVSEIDGEPQEIPPDTLVSMNMIALRPSIFNRLRRQFECFLQTSANDLRVEFQIPDAVNHLLNEERIRIKVLSCTATWFGMTYAEDRPVVESRLQRLVTLGDYPSPLWQTSQRAPDRLVTVFRQFDTSAGSDAALVFTAIPAGHIHDTYKVQNGVGDETWILQRINHEVFPNVAQLMDNIEMVTNHLQDRTTTLGFTPAADGQLFHQDTDGNYWRLRCNPQLASEAGQACGEFLAVLHDLNPDSLSETIPEFHRLSWRLKQFDQVIAGVQHDLPRFSKGSRGSSLQKDLMNRAASAREEIELVNSLRDVMLELEALWTTGQLPQRITHNDTKLTNILFDKRYKAVCVIDLDTVMPGLVHFDFGDALRTIANTAAEDAADVGDVSFDRDLAYAFTHGYLKACGGLLTKCELKTLWCGPGYMTFLMALRFLTDYLAGDRYYKIDYPVHNLLRTRAQFALLRDMNQETSFLQETIESATAFP